MPPRATKSGHPKAPFSLTRHASTHKLCHGDLFKAHVPTMQLQRHGALWTMIEFFEVPMGRSEFQAVLSASKVGMQLKVGRSLLVTPTCVGFT